MATVTERAAPPAAPPAPDRSSDGGTGRQLARFAFATIRRRPERFVLSTLGIALAVMAVVVVRTIAAGFATSGSDSLSAVLRDDPLWVVGADGVRFDPELDVLLPRGTTPAPGLPDGWTAHRTVAGTWTSGGATVALFARDDASAGTAQVGDAAADLLGVAAGDRLTVAGTALEVVTGGAGTSVTIPLAALGGVGAQAVLAAPGLSVEGDWWTVSPSAADADRRDLGAMLTATSGVPSTSDPGEVPSAGQSLAYDTVGGGTSLATFQQGYAALFASQVTSSTLGLVSVVGLVLGFVIAVSSFLAAVQERRREFGIMSSIGLADEVLYFFLVESALVFLAAYTVGALAAGAAVALVVPDVTTLSGWAQASGIVAAYLPAMAIVGALVPVHRLLQQRPVDLLRDEQ